MTPLQRGWELASKNLVSDKPINFDESPLRHIGTNQISKYAKDMCQSIQRLQSMAKGPGWPGYTREYFNESARECMGHLQAMLDALDASGANLIEPGKE